MKIIKYTSVAIIISITSFLIIFSFSNSVKIVYPFRNAVFPPEFPSPTFKWEMKDGNLNEKWEIKFITENKEFIFDTVISKNTWTPRRELWEKLKLLSNHGLIKFEVKKENELHSSSIKFCISQDSIGAPILYRQMPLPFVLAEKMLDSMNYRLIDLGSYDAPNYAMKGFKVCGNCHSFSQDGKTIGLDLDAGVRDKGGYFVSEIKDTMVFDKSNYMSWTKLEKRKTFGLFSKISPDGRYIVSTIKDRVIIKNFPFLPEYLAFSQLFFPVRGHLAIYDRKEKTLEELPGANLDQYVQSNAIWTPDGKNIVFCRAPALELGGDTNQVNSQNDTLIESFVSRKRSFKYDICLIPFNNGKGGEAKLIEGASQNGMSNYFPALSPDGKWLVFCKASNFMLLQPDSRLFIVPLTGGRAKDMICNLPLMNSWHAWSPNGKWLVFVSKGLNVYTDMFLTHIDEAGNASVPILIEKSRESRKVVNYPEFLNANPQKPFTMKYEFVELAHIIMAINSGNTTEAKNLYEQFVEQKQFLFADDFIHLANCLKKMGLNNEAAKYMQLAKNARR